jgi:hypothetical protein
VASTFATRNERGEIRRIERVLQLRLTQQQVDANILSEKTLEAMAPAPAAASAAKVLPIVKGYAKPAARPAGQSWSFQPRGFRPKGRGRRAAG